jgi:hypothetical protein
MAARESGWHGSRYRLRNPAKLSAAPLREYRKRGGRHAGRSLVVRSGRGSTRRRDARSSSTARVSCVSARRSHTPVTARTRRAHRSPARGLRAGSRMMRGPVRAGALPHPQQVRIGATRVRATVPMEIDAPRVLLAETLHEIRERLAALARFTDEPIAHVRLDAEPSRHARRAHAMGRRRVVAPERSAAGRPRHRHGRGCRRSRSSATASVAGCVGWRARVWRSATSRARSRRGLRVSRTSTPHRPRARLRPPELRDGDGQLIASALSKKLITRRSYSCGRAVWPATWRDSGISHSFAESPAAFA